MELKKLPSFNSKRPLLVTQKTNIKFDLGDLGSIHATTISSDNKAKASSHHNPKLEKSAEKEKKLRRRNSVKSDAKNEYEIPQLTIDNFLEKSGFESSNQRSQENLEIVKTRVIEEMGRIYDRANLTLEERQKMYQMAVTMDAPKLARKLVIDANELYLESIEGSSFLTGNSSVDQVDDWSGNAEERREMEAIEADEQFCKAFDEVERIRSRIIQRASISNSPVMHLPVITRAVSSSSYSIHSSTLGGGAERDSSGGSHIISPKSMRISPKFAETGESVAKKFDKPLLSKMGSGNGGTSSRLLRRGSTSGHVGSAPGEDLDSVADAIGDLIESSRPTSGRRADGDSFSGHSSRDALLFQDPFLRPTEDRQRSAASRAEGSNRMAAAQQELLKVKNSMAAERTSSSRPKHGGETPDGRRQGGIDRFQREHDSDSDTDSAAKIAMEPTAPSRRYSSAHPADLNISLSNREPLPSIPQPSSQRAAAAVSGGSTPSSAARLQMNAKLMLLSSPMNDWMHLGRSLSEDEGVGERRGAIGRGGATSGPQHPTIYEAGEEHETALRLQPQKHHDNKFSFEEALSSPSAANHHSADQHSASPSTRHRSRQPHSTRSGGPHSTRESHSRHTPSPGGVAESSNVDILKSYTDQAVVDTVRRALQHLNGLMDASDGEGMEAPTGSKNVPLAIADGKSHSRRQSKDVSQSYSAESDSTKRAERASFKTSSSSSSLLLVDATPPGYSKCEQSSKRLQEDAGDSQSHKAPTLPPRSPRVSSSGHSQPAEGRGGGLSQSHSAFQLGDSTHKRLSALAAALDAGDAVGKLMAEMLVSKK
jgi:hypothetical protein